MKIKEKFYKPIFAVFSLLVTVSYSQYSYADIEQFLSRSPDGHEYIEIEPEFDVVGTNPPLIITHALATEIVEAFRSRRIYRLHIVGTQFEPNVLSMLTEVLQNHASLATLNLRANNIGDIGARAVAEILRTNNALISLDLRGNGIGYEGAQALAGSIRTNYTLTELNLSWNTFGFREARAIISALIDNIRLLHVITDFDDPISQQTVGIILQRNALINNLKITISEESYNMLMFGAEEELHQYFFGVGNFGQINRIRALQIQLYNLMDIQIPEGLRLLPDL